MNDVRRNRCRSPISKKIVREAREHQTDLRHEALDSTHHGDLSQAAQATSDVAFLRAKTEVDVAHEEHRYRMEPKNIYKVKSIVNYHWSPKKRKQMQRQVNKITEPIENQTLDEVWQTIKERKAAKMDVSNVLDGLNLSRSYNDVTMRG